MFKILLALLTTATLAAATPAAMTITTNSAVILPTRPVRTGVVWTNGIEVGNGQVLLYENNLYFAESAGTSTNTPVIGTTTARLRHMRSGERAAATVQNLGVIAAFISFDGPAVANKGLKLEPGAAVTLTDVPGAISAVTATSTTTLGMTEVTK